MRKSAYSAGAVLASVALLAVGAPTVAQAQTSKELNVCWTNTANGVTDLEFVADGPSYRTASLDTGDCMAWDVKGGTYKLTVEDMTEFLAAIDDECDDYGAPGNGHWVDLNGNGTVQGNEWQDEPSISIKIKRQNDSYKAFNLAALANGAVFTDVKDNRRSLVSITFSCTT